MNICHYKKLGTWRIIVVCIILFVALCGFSSITLSWNGWGGRQSFYVGVFLFFFCLLNYKHIGKGEMVSVSNWTLITAMCSIIPAFVDWNAQLVSYVYGFLTTYYGIFFYYALKIWKVEPRVIMKIICVFCLVWVFLEIGQQFTYPQYWFLGRQNEYDYIEKRMGLWRFYIWGIDFVMLAFAYYAGKYFDGVNTKKVIVCALIFAIGILCYCSRKHIISLLAVCFYGILKTKSKHKWMIRGFSVLLLLLLFFNFYADFNQMNQEQNEAQGSGEDFIRYLAAMFYLNDFSDSVLYPIFGTGWGSVSLNHRLEYCTGLLKFYRADIGLLGYYSEVGFVGVSAILFYIFKIIRNWKYIDLGYKMFFIMKLFLIIFDFWMMWAVGIMAYGTFLYLLDENIKKNKLKYEYRGTDIL